MLTRSRFSSVVNENKAANAKSHPSRLKVNDAQNHVAKSRSVLGDLKNKTTELHSRELGTQKLSKKCISNVADVLSIKTKGRNDCAMHIDDSAAKFTYDLNEEQLQSLKAFRESRYQLRKKCLEAVNAMDYVSIDKFDFNDGATVSDYADTVFNYLQDRELCIQPLSKEYMAPNPDVTPRMRYILVNWLVQVHQSYKMSPETLYLSVAILDRYLQKCGSNLAKDKFQLIGVTALFIAAKFEEMFPPDIGDFSAITDNAYTKKDLRASEQQILQDIDFYLSIPIPLIFLRRLSRAVDADRQMHNLAKYLLELTIQEYDLAALTGNLRAAVALCLARALCLQSPNLNVAWTNVMSYLSGFNLADIEGPLRILARAAYRQNSPSKFRAIFDKYRLDDFYDRVAALPQLRSSLMETLADLKFDDDGSEAVAR